MPLNKTALAAALTTIFEDLDTSATATQKASDIADAIDDYVKTGLVTVSTTGATLIGTPGGPLTISAQPGTGSIT